MNDEPETQAQQPGFLPIETNWFDRLFIAVVIWVALSLFWMRFIEPLGLSVWIATALSAALGAVIVWKG
jgi:predicted small integral membrane protein